jgi:two-component system sensor histidine kinase RpfC
MPDNTGLDVIKQARLLEAGLRQRTPIIILSADVTLETVREVEANGAYAYLSKPLVIEKLLDLLATIAGENRPDTTPAPTDSETPRVSILKGLIDMDVDPESLQHLLEQCLTDATDCIGQIERAGAASRWEELRDGLHALCGVAVNIGAGALADRCASLMREVPSDLASHWRRDVDGLSGLLAAASVEVRLQIEGLTGFKDLERREAPPV